MNDRPHKPVAMSPWRLEAAESEEDALWRLHPERQMAIAHDTAHLLARGQEALEQKEILQRLRAFVDREGLDTLAELWSGADPVSLPRALYRLFQLREQVVAHPHELSQLMTMGIESLHTIDPYVVGAEVPVTAESVLTIIDQILAGSFTGDLAHELDRAASLSKLVSAGVLAWSERNGGDEHALALNSLVWGDVAKELADCAVRERKGQLS